MATLQLQCPTCRHRLALDAGFAGGVCRCSQCGALMTVPRRSGASPERVQGSDRPASPLARPQSPTDAASASTRTAPARPADPAPPEPGYAPADDDPFGAGHDPAPDADLELDLAALRGPEDDAEHADRDAEPIKKPTAAGRLQHYLRALHRHYAGRTPQDLANERLRPHAEYLTERHHRIASRLLHMIAPKGSRRARAQGLAHQSPAWRDYFNSACENHAAIAAELKEIERYWGWIVNNRRLPSRLVGRFAVYNKRRIAHPWTTLSASVLECLGQLDAELTAERDRKRDS